MDEKEWIHLIKGEHFKAFIEILRFYSAVGCRRGDSRRQSRGGKFSEIYQLDDRVVSLWPLRQGLP